MLSPVATPARVTATEQQTDLRYIVRKLQPHLAVSGSAQVAAFRRLAKTVVGEAAKPLPRWRLLLLADRLLNFFHDPHTFMYASQASDTTLPIGFHWVQGGIAAYPVAGSPAQIAMGDSVVSIGGLSPSALETRLRRFYAGNSYWLRYFAGERLNYGYLLHWLGVVHDGKVAVALRTPEGRTLRLRLPLRPLTYRRQVAQEIGWLQFYNRFRAPAGLQVPLRSNWAWRVTPSYGVFWLTACQNTKAYNDAVNRFFQAVAKAHAPVVVLDLQGNGGGYTTVVYAWLHHLPGTRRLDNLLGDTAASPVQAPVFRGKVYVLQSWSTFSAAVILDADLTAPHFATRVGQPTGWSTGGWAAVQNYTTPYLKLPFQVATMNFPTTTATPLPVAVKPQIPLALTLQDVQTGTNPVQQWLLGIARTAAQAN